MKKKNSNPWKLKSTGVKAYGEEWLPWEVLEHTGWFQSSKVKKYLSSSLGVSQVVGLAHSSLAARWWKGGMEGWEENFLHAKPPTSISVSDPWQLVMDSLNSPRPSACQRKGYVKGCRRLKGGGLFSCSPLSCTVALWVVQSRLCTLLHEKVMDRCAMDSFLWGGGLKCPGLPLGISQVESNSAETVLRVLVDKKGDISQ